MIHRNLYIDLLSGLFMSNTENPTRPSISGEPAGRVFIQTGETNMNNTTKTNANTRGFFHWENKEDFIEYLEENLIPDLKDSELFATAEDFETAVHFMKGGK